MRLSVKSPELVSAFIEASRTSKSIFLNIESTGTDFMFKTFKIFFY
jgi:hypothetical protein